MPDENDELKPEELVKLTTPHFNQLDKTASLRDLEAITDKILDKLQNPVIYDANLAVVLRLRREQYRRLWKFEDRKMQDKWQHKDERKAMKRKRRAQVKAARKQRRAEFWAARRQRRSDRKKKETPQPPAGEENNGSGTKRETSPNS